MRVRAVVIAVAALAAVLWPMVRQPPVDSFPLSTYPMFTRLRPQVTTIDLAVGLDADGRDVRLDPHLVGGTIEVIQAVATVGRSIATGTAADLCAEVAERVAAAGGREHITGIAVVTDSYDVVDALAHDAPPQHRHVHARCEVGS